MSRKVYLESVSLKEAMRRFLPRFQDLSLPCEEIKVTEALGRVTSEPVYARRFAPHYHASAMDGIAVRAKDTEPANERNPVLLREGLDFRWVDTGQPIPEGFDAVIKVEDVNSAGDGLLAIEAPVTPWENIRSIGESAISGQMIVPTNQEITAYHIGALLEAGVTEIKVRRKPRVSIIPTGTELVPPDAEPGPGQLVEFNSGILSAYAAEWGAAVHVTEIVPDDYDRIREAVTSRHSESDITVLIAGSSAGRKDYAYGILQELGEVLVHGVNIMPGKPVILAIVDGKPVVGIPGYPLAAIFNYYLFVRPLIYLLSGLPVPETPKVEAKVNRKVPSHAGVMELLRVNLAHIDGEFVAVPRKRGSAAMESLLGADGIMAVPESSEGLEPQSKVEVYTLKPLRELKSNLLLVGSHDFCLDILADTLRRRRAGFAINVQSVGSMSGLMALKRKEAHLAGSHLLDEETGEYNISYIKRLLPDRRTAVVNLVFREQGLLVAKGNPKRIKGVADLVRDDVTYVNRQRGAGTRVLLDYLLRTQGISPADIRGYEREKYTHIEVAAAVVSAEADAALGVMAAAKAMDLDFIPIAEERYDLVMPAEMLEDERIEFLLEVLRSQEFRADIERLGGYRTDTCGDIVEIV